MSGISNKILVAKLYQRLLEAWNKRDAHEFAALFAEDADVIGFDGSQMCGCEEIETSLSQIFANHPTAAYISVVRRIRFLSPDLASLNAVVGMIPPNQDDINPQVNAIQTLLCSKCQDEWRISLLQNTPAQYHGRPDLAEALCSELRMVL